MSPDLIVTHEGPLTRLTLNRPDKANALSPSLVQALTSAVDEAERDGTRLLVIDGNGRHFCAGFDLSDLATETDDSLLARIVRIELLLQRVRAAPFATVALASGRAMGAGADLFAACEARWIVGSASFAFPGAAFGLVLGTGRLADLVGPERTREWVGSGTVVDADQALAAGLATARKNASEISASLQALEVAAMRLDPVTHAAIRQASRRRGTAGAATDLAALVASAARPGLRQRIVDYQKAMTS
jgi:enoyl-CoA hydratase/carnithine racemase